MSIIDLRGDELKRLPVVSLIIVNLIPLWGVLFAGWDAFSVVLLYWSENIIIGFYNILKIATAKVDEPIKNAKKLFLIPFFLVHYGGFCGVHGVFVIALFGNEPEGLMDITGWPCFFVFVEILFNVIRSAFSLMPVNMKYAVFAVFISHGISFVHNYILKGEYRRTTPEKLMGSPYARIIILHIAIIAGGFLTMSLGSPLGLLAVLVFLKTVMDLSLHQREHRKTYKR